NVERERRNEDLVRRELGAQRVLEFLFRNVLLLLLLAADVGLRPFLGELDVDVLEDTENSSEALDALEDRLQVELERDRRRRAVLDLLARAAAARVALVVVRAENSVVAGRAGIFRLAVARPALA